jgi:hypothetical protein
MFTGEADLIEDWVCSWATSDYIVFGSWKRTYNTCSPSPGALHRSEAVFTLWYSLSLLLVVVFAAAPSRRSL